MKRWIHAVSDATKQSQSTLSDIVELLSKNGIKVNEYTQYAQRGYINFFVGFVSSSFYYRKDGEGFARFEDIEKEEFENFKSAKRLGWISQDSEMDTASEQEKVAEGLENLVTANFPSCTLRGTQLYGTFGYGKLSVEIKLTVI